MDLHACSTLIPEALRRATFDEEKVVHIVNGTRDNDLLYAAKDGRNTFISAKAGDDTVLGGPGNDWLSGCAGNDILCGRAGDDRVLGGRGHDLLWGDGGNDELFGGAGNDGIDGGYGHDIIEGDGGNDTLVGGLGDDTFLFMTGDGNDVIESPVIERRRAAGERDEVVFRDHYAHDLTAVFLAEGEGRMSGRDLVVYYGDCDSITIRGQDSPVGLAITHFRFSDGMLVDYERLLEMYSGEGGRLAPEWAAQRPLQQDALLTFQLNASPVEANTDVYLSGHEGYQLTWIARDGASSQAVQNVQNVLTG